MVGSGSTTDEILHISVSLRNPQSEGVGLKRNGLVTSNKDLVT